MPVPGLICGVLVEHQRAHSFCAKTTFLALLRNSPQKLLRVSPNPRIAPQPAENLSAAPQLGHTAVSRSAAWAGTCGVTSSDVRTTVASKSRVDP